MSAPFALDKPNARLMGACSGFARYANIDVTLTRIAVVLATIFTGGTAAVVYLVAGFVAPNA